MNLCGASARGRHPTYIPFFPWRIQKIVLHPLHFPFTSEVSPAGKKNGFKPSSRLVRKYNLPGRRGHRHVYKPFVCSLHGKRVGRQKEKMEMIERIPGRRGEAAHLETMLRNNDMWLRNMEIGRLPGKVTFELGCWTFPSSFFPPSILHPSCHHLIIIYSSIFYY